MLQQVKKTIYFCRNLCFFVFVGISGLALYNMVAPKPIATPDHMVTYHLGNVAFNLPASWKSGGINARFYLTDNITGPRIDFIEKPLAKGETGAEELKKALDSAGKSGEREDLSEKFGRPAGLIINPFIIQSVRPAPRRFSEPPDPSYELLFLSLYVLKPQAILIFYYTERFASPDDDAKRDFTAAKRMRLINWGLDFLSRYKGVGRDRLDPGNFLLTAHGQTPNDSPISMYDLNVTFKQDQRKESRAHRPNHFFISLRSTPGGHNAYGQPNRTVAGRAGHEEKSINIAPRSFFEELKFWKPELQYIHLTWKDLSSKAQEHKNPELFIKYLGYSDTEGYPEFSQWLDDWKILLDSVRTVPEI